MPFRKRASGGPATGLSHKGKRPRQSRAWVEGRLTLPDADCQGFITFGGGIGLPNRSSARCSALSSAL